MWKGGRVLGRGGDAAQTPGGGRGQRAHHITYCILCCNEGRGGGGSPVGGESRGCVCNLSCVRVCVSSRTPSPMDSTVSLTAVAVETTSKSPDQRQSSQEVEVGEGWQGIRLHNNQGEERYQPSKAEVGEPNKDSDCFGSGQLCSFSPILKSL